MKQLPYVTNEVGYSLIGSLELGEKPDTELVKDELKRIRKANPAVAEFITRWSKLAGSKDSKYHSAFCGILVYKLLESQAEADWMNETLVG